MTLTQVITIVAAVGGPAGLVAIIMVFPQIRKLQADTSKVELETELAEIDGATRLSDAALNQMRAAVERADHAEARAGRAEVAVGELRERIEAVSRLLHEYRQIAQEHVAWDFQIVQMLRTLGLAEEEIPQPPPLLPPNPIKGPTT